MKAETLIFFKKIFTRGFYLRFFDFVIEFFHLEGHSIDLVKENIDFEYSFSFPFSFDLISFMMVQRLVNGGSNSFFFFFFPEEIEEQLKGNSHLTLLDHHALETYH